MITGRSGRPIPSVRWCAPLLGITRVPCRVTEWCARPVVRIGVGLEKERRSGLVSECEVNRKVQGRCSSKLRVRESRSWGSRAAGGNSASLLPFVARLSIQPISATPTTSKIYKRYGRPSPAAMGRRPERPSDYKTQDVDHPRPTRLHCPDHRHNLKGPTIYLLPLSTRLTSSSPSHPRMPSPRRLLVKLLQPKRWTL